MPLHLVGDNIDKARSHSQAEKGRLVQLMRGIYVDAGDDIDATVLRHAVRIAHYLYPQAYLAAASAMQLVPTRDGRLYLSGKRNQRTRIRSLEIVQNLAPKQPSTGSAIIKDGMGEFRINASSMRQRFLEAFRVRSEHAASIDADARAALAVRLVAEYGDAKAAADAVWALARDNHRYHEGECAERYLIDRPAAVQVSNQAALDFLVAWHGRVIGHVRHDGFEWRWEAQEDGAVPLIRQTIPGQLPSFIVSLLPEGWLEAVFKDQDERALLCSGKRYTSNITIVERSDDLAAMPVDLLLTRLDAYTTDGAFTGRYAGPGRSDIADGFERNLARIYERGDTPRLSGAQIKAPMFLAADGTLSPSVGKPFTHILKPAGTGGYDDLPLIEWLGMTLGRAVGFTAPSIALVAMPDEMPPALVVERFDIRSGPSDRRQIALEDICSVLGLTPRDKYQGTMERVAHAIRPLSTAPAEDMQILCKRALFAWLIADGDMHLKNLALLKIAEPGASRFQSVRLAPLYDAVTTRVFPRLRNDRLALKINGKDDRLRRSDFRTFANLAGVNSKSADAMIDEMVSRLTKTLSSIALPHALTYRPAGRRLAEEMLSICRDRAGAVQ